MTTLNAKANNAYHALISKYERENSDHLWPGFDDDRHAFEEGWENGVGAVAEDIASIIEEYADDLEPPTTVEWLELRDWFKDLLHEVAAKARESGGVS